MLAAEMTRNDVARLLRWEGNLVYEEKVDEFWKNWQESMARQKAFDDAGIKVSYRKHLLKMTKIEMRGGRLHDGVCHYQHQVTVAGDTYALRDTLKAAGYRWDAADKLWQRPMTMKGKSIHDHVEQAKDELLAALA